MAKQKPNTSDPSVRTEDNGELEALKAVHGTLLRLMGKIPLIEQLKVVPALTEEVSDLSKSFRAAVPILEMIARKLTAELEKRWQDSYPE